MLGEGDWNRLADGERWSCTLKSFWNSMDGVETEDAKELMERDDIANERTEGDPTECIENVGDVAREGVILLNVVKDRGPFDAGVAKGDSGALRRGGEAVSHMAPDFGLT